jgi:hypothetical protein
MLKNFYAYIMGTVVGLGGRERNPQALPEGSASKRIHLKKEIR